MPNIAKIKTTSEMKRKLLLSNVFYKNCYSQTF